SKIIKNLSFTGDIIDVFGPTGGFNLQIAWSSAYVAVTV
ncbi:TPA: aminoacetone oxidase family FAD-binding enzyme, partial [Patescibacteria group bacterium]|nr:aminoacetone oxidase family FAD-binding enzyme [Patescibacteria group bacterium]